MSLSTNQFNEFRRAVEKYFAFLTEDHALVLSAATGKSYRDTTVRFSKPGFLVGVGYELGSDPWVYFEIDTDRGRRGFGLHIVVEEADGPLDVMGKSESLTDKVQVLGELTRSYGNFSTATCLGYQRMSG